MPAKAICDRDSWPAHPVTTVKDTAHTPKARMLA